jgi:hypothetical protein
MRTAVSSDLDEPVAPPAAAELHRRGHCVTGYGALRAGDGDDWAWSAESAAPWAVDGRFGRAAGCRRTGTGAARAANGRVNAAHLVETR